MSKPIISIGMIFKNEIRCLERCLKSLQPLRDAIPCELVMADTGADDGSREVAEQYADILFDFPWINDFATARNAVMERCSGTWYLSIDADEWLDEDVSELLQAMRNDALGKPLCAVMIRNFFSKDLSGDYSDFLAIRMVRMSTGARYEGAIHEHFISVSNDIYALMHMIVKHDGYMFISKEKSKEKHDRNMSLLRKKLESNPRDLMTLLQCIESSSGTWEHEGFLRRAVAGVKERLPNWQQIGQPIMRHAVNFAESNQLEEESEWIELARSLFPTSPYTLVDVTYASFFKSVREKDTQGAIADGEGYLSALEDYRAGRINVAALIYSTLGMVSVSREITIRIVLTNTYIEEKQFSQARQVFDRIDTNQLSVHDVKNYLGTALNLHAQAGANMSQTITQLWELLEQSTENAAKKSAMLSAAGQAFTPEYRKAESEKGFRHAYTVFLPLAGRYGPGTAAAILETQDAQEIEKLLGQVQNWAELPIHALTHALKHSVRFPLSEQPLYIEAMDGLAARLMADKDNLSLAVKLANALDGTDQQQVLWNRGLVLAAVRAFDWKSGEAESGLELARTFAKIEAAFLPLCYCQDALTKSGLSILPPMHRFGWYCVQAFDALDSGDTKGYVHHLREGLSTCEGMKNMVEFLIDHTPEIKTSVPSQELLNLAEQVRSLLMAYAPDAPAVTVIKQSPAYQKVAYLIEGIEAPVMGGIAQ